MLRLLLSGRNNGRRPDKDRSYCPHDDIYNRLWSILGGPDCARGVRSVEVRLRVLVACEFSGIVRDAFIARGHDAMSCDLLPPESPGPHYTGSVFDILNDGWDMMIAHPPCTHLACSGAAWFEKKKKNGKQQNGIDFFMKLAEASINKICVENPVGIMSSLWRTPDQIIQPYYFGDEYQKTTCLWLKNLLKLKHIKVDDLFDKATHVNKGEMIKYASGKVMPKWYAESRGNGHLRSRTFQGIAKAMAEQWG